MSDTLGIDLGTSSIKVARFDATGRLLVCVSQGYHRPDEHEVGYETIWSVLRETIRTVLARTANGSPIVAVGLSSQTNSFALLGDDHRLLTPIFFWTGDFAGDEAREIMERLSPQVITNVSGMSALTGQFLAPKCLHLARNASEIWRQTRAIRLLPDLITEVLCGQARTDPSLWSLTGFYGPDRCNWWPEMLRLLGIESCMLPELSVAGRIAGRLGVSVARELGLPAGIPVAVGTLDHLAAAVGVGNATPQIASLSTGTASCIVVTHALRPSVPKAGVIGLHPASPNTWFSLTWSGLSSTGLNWYARECGSPSDLPHLIDAAGHVPAGADGWLAVPRDPSSGDAGFDFRHDAVGDADRPEPAEAMRAILERISEEIHGLLRDASAGTPVRNVIAVGGGARSDVWLQLLAARLAVPVVRPDSVEAAVIGAGRFAAMAAGQIDRLEDVHTSIERVFYPSS